MDFLSTWVATPNLVLEGNPIAKKLGWRWGIPLNLALCFGVRLLAAAGHRRQHHQRAGGRAQFSIRLADAFAGREIYRDWHVERIQETSITLYLFCLAGKHAAHRGGRARR